MKKNKINNKWAYNGIILVIVLLALGMLIFYLGFLQENTSFKFYPISELKERTGNFSTEGYVLSVFYCVSGPAGLPTLPCPDPSIIIAQKENDSFDFSESELKLGLISSSKLLILTPFEDPQNFKVGKKYFFNISKSDDTRSNPIPYSNEPKTVLVSYSPLD
jgi:hypothetical protein